MLCPQLAAAIHVALPFCALALAVMLIGCYREVRLTAAVVRARHAVARTPAVSALAQAQTIAAGEWLRGDVSEARARR